MTYRVDAARAQSYLRRFMAISRGLTLDEIDETAWGMAKQTIVGWMGAQLVAIKAAGQFAAAERGIPRVGLKTLGAAGGRSHRADDQPMTPRDGRRVIKG